MLEVKMDEVKILYPDDNRKAIGTRNLNGCSCLVVMGRAYNDGIVMAHIGPFTLPGGGGGSSSAGSSKEDAVSRGDKHFMKLFRQVANAILQSQKCKQFLAPIAWGIFGRFDDEVPLAHLRERAKRAFKDLGIKATYSTYEVLLPGATRLPEKGTVFAVRNESHGPELYVEDVLKYPEDNTGALELEMRNLGIKPRDASDGDEDENEDEEDEDAEGSDDEDAEGSDDEEPGGRVDKDEKTGSDSDEEGGNNGSEKTPNLSANVSSSHGQTPLSWMFAENSYTCLQNGKPIKTQKLPPKNVEIWDRANSRTLYYDGTTTVVVPPGKTHLLKATSSKSR